MDKEASQHLQSRVKPICWIIVSITLIIVGIILLSLFRNIYTDEVAVEYTNCSVNATDCPETSVNCVCYISFNVTHDLLGTVRFYYELETFDQNNSSYVQSRDNNQLAGLLSPTPSSACDPYTYNEKDKKPIAPCGAIAEYMSKDTYALIAPSNNDDYVPVLFHGMIDEKDKRGFHNPPGNLSEALQNFSNPSSWTQNLWEMDTENPNNNGFEYEPFIGWMHTEWKRKPIMRLNNNNLNYSMGLPKNSYLLRVEYYEYPISTIRYSGRRRLIAVSTLQTSDYGMLAGGIVLLCVGIMMAIPPAYSAFRYRNYKYLYTDWCSAIRSQN